MDIKIDVDILQVLEIIILPVRLILLHVYCESRRILQFTSVAIVSEAKNNSYTCKLQV